MKSLPVLEKDIGFMYTYILIYLSYIYIYFFLSLIQFLHIQDSVMAFRTYKAYFFPSCVFYNKSSVSAQIFAGKNASCLRKSLKTQRMNGSFTALSPRKAKLRLA